MEIWINGHRFDHSTAKAPQLLGSVQCNDSTRQSGFQAARLEGAKAGTGALHSNYAMACSSFLRA